MDFFGFGPHRRYSALADQSAGSFVPPVPHHSCQNGRAVDSGRNTLVSTPCRIGSRDPPASPRHTSKLPQHPPAGPRGDPTQENMPGEEGEVERDESGTIFESRVQRLVQKADNLRFKPSPDVGDTIIKLSEFFQNIYLQWHDLVGIWITQSHKATFPAPGRTTLEPDLSISPGHRNNSRSS